MTNENVRSIMYRGRELPLFYHPYNCGEAGDSRTTERSVEVALADHWLQQRGDDAVEVGAVTPYYFPGRLATVIDPFDGHELVTVRKSLFEADFSGRNVLSLSTVEHVGTGDYDGVSVHENCIRALQRLLRLSAACLITFPLGYNAVLDDYVLGARFGGAVTVTYIYRGPLHNDWQTTMNAARVRGVPYGPFGANAVAVVEKENAAAKNDA